VIFDGALDLAEERRRSAGRGRFSARERVAGRGRHIRAARPAPGEKGFEVAVDATLRAAALRRSAGGGGGEAAGSADGSVRGGAVGPLLPGDLRKKVRVGRGNRLVLFLVDASDSMAGQAGLSAAKGAALALLSAAYLRRDRVGLIAFRGEKARVLLQPTSSVRRGEKMLRLLTAGGATPLASGLLEAWKTLRADRLKHPSVRTSLVILSDGEANVPLSPGGDKAREIRDLAGMIRREKIRVIFVDTNPPERERPEPREYAACLDAQYRRIARLRSRDLLEIVDKED